MKNINAVKSAPTAAPAVQTIKKTVFAFKTRTAIAPKGLLKGIFTVAVNETGGAGDDEFNRFHTELEVTDAKGSRFLISRDYNILPNGRGLNAFLNDYNSWSSARLTEDDLYNEFDGDTMVKGKTVVVEIGHRKLGKEWEAYIAGFHPADYAGTLPETAEAALAA